MSQRQDIRPTMTLLQLSNCLKIKWSKRHLIWRSGSLHCNHIDAIYFLMQAGAAMYNKWNRNRWQIEERHQPKRDKMKLHTLIQIIFYDILFILSFHWLKNIKCWKPQLKNPLTLSAFHIYFTQTIWPYILIILYFFFFILNQWPCH